MMLAGRVSVAPSGDPEPERAFHVDGPARWAEEVRQRWARVVRAHAELCSEDDASQVGKARTLTTEDAAAYDALLRSFAEAVVCWSWECSISAGPTGSNEASNWLRTASVPPTLADVSSKIPGTHDVHASFFARIISAMPQLLLAPGAATACLCILGEADARSPKATASFGGDVATRLRSPLAVIHAVHVAMARAGSSGGAAAQAERKHIMDPIAADIDASQVGRGLMCCSILSACASNAAVRRASLMSDNDAPLLYIITRHVLSVIAAVMAELAKAATSRTASLEVHAKLLDVGDMFVLQLRRMVGCVPADLQQEVAERLADIVARTASDLTSFAKAYASLELGSPSSVSPAATQHRLAGGVATILQMAIPWRMVTDAPTEVHDMREGKDPALGHLPPQVDAMLQSTLSFAASAVEGADMLTELGASTARLARAHENATGNENATDRLPSTALESSLTALRSRFRDLVDSSTGAQSGVKFVAAVWSQLASRAYAYDERVVAACDFIAMATLRPLAARVASFAKLARGTPELLGTAPSGIRAGAESTLRMVTRLLSPRTPTTIAALIGPLCASGDAVHVISSATLWQKLQAAAARGASMTAHGFTTGTPIQAAPDAMSIAEYIRVARSGVSVATGPAAQLTTGAIPSAHRHYVRMWGEVGVGMASNADEQRSAVTSMQELRGRAECVRPAGCAGLHEEESRSTECCLLVDLVTLLRAYLSGEHYDRAVTTAAVATMREVLVMSLVEPGVMAALLCSRSSSSERKDTHDLVTCLCDVWCELHARLSALHCSVGGVLRALELVRNAMRAGSTLPGADARGNETAPLPEEATEAASGIWASLPSIRRPTLTSGKWSQLDADAAALVHSARARRVLEAYIVTQELVRALAATLDLRTS